MKASKKIDSKLVVQYQSGQEFALAELVKRWHKTFCNKSYWLVKDKDVAKDIAQESWRIIMYKLSDLKEPNSFGNWAMRIVYTKSLDWIKNANNEKQKQEAYYYQQSVTDIEFIDNQNLKNALLKAIQSLSEHQQIVIKLFYVEAYSLNEMSSLLNISLGTVKSRLFHAREKLKQILKANNWH